MNSTSQTITKHKPLTSLDLENKIQEHIKQLAGETDQVRQSKWFNEYLDCLSKFWRYSLRNQLLIFMQKPIASRVAGFRTWNELERSVKAGEKAIKILAPFTKKIVKKDLTTGEEKEISFTYFYPVNVFDITQTIGKELPQINIDVQGNSHEWLLKKLLDFCKNQNIAVEFKQLGVNGFYGYSQGGKITIASNQSINMQVNTLVHEIAHELLHQNIDGKKFSKNEKELQAESVSYVVCKNYGLNPKSPNYLALYKADKNKILENLETISKTSKKILEFLKSE